MIDELKSVVKSTDSFEKIKQEFLDFTFRSREGGFPFVEITFKALKKIEDAT